MPPEDKPTRDDDDRRKKRPARGDGPRDWKPREKRGGPRREGSGGPRREWKPRGDRPDRGPRRDRDDRGPRRDRDDRGPRREGSDGPRREWKPRGDRPDRGPRREGSGGPRRDRDDRGPRREGSGGPRRDRDDRGPRREGSDGPRREWKPRGDRPDRGPRRDRDDRGPRREGSGGPRREWKPRGDRPDRGPRRDRDDRGPRRDRDDRGPRRDRDDVPQTEAQRRRSEVFARKGPRKYGKDKPFGARPDREERVIDEGSVRKPRFEGSKRPSRDAPRSKSRAPRREDGPMFPTPPALQEPLAGEVRRAVGDRRYESVSAQLSRALVAYDAERYREALSVLSPVLEDLWLIADVRVLAGRLEYRAQRWKNAAEHLEFARGSDRSDMTNLPVLIDCYRALKRYQLVDELWSELKEASPHPMIMAEGRVSAAMSYADRGDVQTAIRMMTHGADPRQVQPHHLMEWYVLGDLHDRAGDAVSAKRFFSKVVQSDAKYFDAAQRLATLGN